MTVVEYRGGPVTHRYLMNKSKHDLARLYMELLRIATPDEGETMFTIRLRKDGSTQMRTQAASGADPRAVLEKGREVLEAEMGALDRCPIHFAQSNTLGQTP